MAFPETRHTLIQRIATAGQESDWQQFLVDYWGPVCRFAARYGHLGLDDAEDVASKTFEALLTSQLLTRWLLNRSAKLRTLLCSVTRNVLSNRGRVAQGRAQLMRAHLEQGGDLPSLDVQAEQLDAFYLTWVEEVLEQAVESIQREYHQSGKGDYFRVLYGRICEDMSMGEIAACLQLKVTSVENYYKSARKRLAAVLEELVREHVGRYAPEGSEQDEFAAEWAQLGDCLEQHGGVEQAIRRAYSAMESIPPERKTERIGLVVSRLLQKP